MKKWSLILMVALIGLAISCSSITTQYDYERGEDFSRFKTYSFLPVPPELAQNKLVVKRIGQAIIKNLATKGLTRSDSNPDLNIAVYTEDEEIQLTEVFTAIHTYEKGKETISPKSDGEDLKDYFGGQIQ